jgi:hypothetical protein
MDEMLIILENALEAVLHDEWHTALHHETLEKVRAALRQIKEEKRKKGNG